MQRCLYISFEVPLAFFTLTYISAISFSSPVMISESSRDLFSAYVVCKAYLLLDGLELHIGQLLFGRLLRWGRRRGLRLGLGTEQSIHDYVGIIR